MPTTKVNVTLPASTDIEYKYIKLVGRNGTSTWEPGSNNKFTTPSNGTAAVYDVWGSTSDADSEDDVRVTFNVNATTVYGENVYLVGNLTELGEWNDSNAIPLKPTNYPTWSVDLSLPGSTTLEYKFIKIAGMNVTWQSGLNNVYTTPSNGSVVVNTAWNVASNTAAFNTSSPVRILFNVNATTTFGQNVYLTGNLTQLSNWGSTNTTAIALSATGYPTWSANVTVPGNTALEYKYFITDGPNTTWESGPNTLYITPSNGSVIINDSWH